MYKIHRMGNSANCGMMFSEFVYLVNPVNPVEVGFLFLIALFQEIHFVFDYAQGI